MTPNGREVSSSAVRTTDPGSADHVKASIPSAPALGDCCGQRRRRCAPDRRLDDRLFDLEQVAERRPHAATVLRPRDSCEAPAVSVSALPDSRAAQELVARHARRTPLLTSRLLSEETGFDVRLKAELFQRTGSYKLRGPLVKLARLTDEERARGVVCSSAGNHAQGVALAAALLGVRAVVVMAENATPSKIEATRGYGAEVVLHGSIWDEADTKARELVKSEQLTYVHPFDDVDLIAGQGTVGLEILEDWPEVELLVVPIGGGGLISGIATAVKRERPDVRVVGVESADGPAMKLSVERGELVTLDRVDTIVDGLRVKRVGETTFELVRRFVDEIVAVPDEWIFENVLWTMAHTSSSPRARPRRRSPRCAEATSPRRRGRRSSACSAAATSTSRNSAGCAGISQTGAPRRRQCKGSLQRVAVRSETVVTFPGATAPQWRRGGHRRHSCSHGSLRDHVPRHFSITLLIALGVVAAGPAGGAANEPDLVRVVIQFDDAPLAKYRDTLPGLKGVLQARTDEGHVDVKAPASKAYLAHLRRSTPTSSSSFAAASRTPPCSGSTTPPSTA